MDINGAIQPGLGQSSRYAQVVAALAYWQEIAARPTAAPGFTNAASGGTVANGTYLAGYTWITALGETEVSVLASTTTGGTGISTMTVTPPAFPAGVTQWNCYVGTPLSKQNGAPLTAASLLISAPPTTGGATPPPNPLQAELGAFGSIYNAQPSYTSLANALQAITFLTNELARMNNPAAYTGPMYSY